MLNDELVRAGNWLFRWRSYVPLAVTAVLLAAMNGFHYPYGSHTLDLVWDFFCFGIALVGLAIRVGTVGFVRGRTSGRNTRGQLADELNTTGLYSIVRHPLYLGNCWIWLGIALFPRVWWLPLVVCALFALIYERIMLAEESFLRERFAAVYERWATATPALFPWSGTWQPPRYSFSLSQVLRRENSTLLGISTAFFVLETVGETIVEHAFTLDPVWTTVFGATLVLYVVLRVLKKTNRLREPLREPKPAK